MPHSSRRWMLGTLMLGAAVGGCATQTPPGNEMSQQVGAWAENHEATPRVTTAPAAAPGSVTDAPAAFTPTTAPEVAPITPPTATGVVNQEGEPITLPEAPRGRRGTSKTLEPRLVEIPSAMTPATEPARDITTGGPFDRSSWPRIVVTAEDGRTRHFPEYFHDCPIPNHEPQPMAAPGVEAALTAALDGQRAGYLSAENLAALPTQPVKFFFDVGVLPLSMVLQPPLPDQTTPPTPCAP